MDNKRELKKEDNDNSKNLQKMKEVDIMAMAQLQRSTAITIDKNRTQEFFKTLSNNRPSDEFWDNCKKARKSFTKDDINTINLLIKKRLENDR
jgi:hypothetical protein